MRALAIEQFSSVSAGADLDVKMQSEGASVFCPNNICPTVSISGPMNYGSLSPSGWDNVVGAAGGAAIGWAATEFAGGVAIGLGLALTPLAAVGALVVVGAAAGVALQYGLAYMQQGEVTYGRYQIGTLTGEP